MLYRGYRGQEQTGVRLTQGSFASEGVGVYIALERELAAEFAGSGRYLQELEFELTNPLMVGRSESLHALHESPELEEPLNKTDSPWLRANKKAYQQAMRKTSDNWSAASELLGHYLTAILQKMGYDGVMIEHGPGSRWAVVFDPAQVKVLREDKQARETRLAYRLTRLALVF